MNCGESIWTDGMDAQLKAMRARGLSYGVIGERLGISKNAAIGRGFRLGLPAVSTLKEMPRQRSEGRRSASRTYVIQPSAPPPPPPDPVTAQIRSREQSLVGPERVIEAAP